MIEDYLLKESWYAYLLLFALVLAEIIFSVSLCVVEDFNENDLEKISDRMNLKNIKALNDFLDKRSKYENRFHAALIAVHLLIFIPVGNIISQIVLSFGLNELNAIPPLVISVLAIVV